MAMSSLLPVIESDEVLCGVLGKGSDKDRLDIEGIAERGETLFFRLRLPNVSGYSLVVEVYAKALFTDGAKAAPRMHELALDEGRGIRDLVRARDGFLLISDQATNDKASDGFVLYYWQGPDGKLTQIGKVPGTSGRPEGLSVLEEPAYKVTLLVVFDGDQTTGGRA